MKLCSRYHYRKNANDILVCVQHIQSSDVIRCRGSAKSNPDIPKSKAFTDQRDISTVTQFYIKNNVMPDLQKHDLSYMGNKSLWGFLF